MKNFPQIIFLLTNVSQYLVSLFLSCFTLRVEGIVGANSNIDTEKPEHYIGKLILIKHSKRRRAYGRLH